MNLDEALATFLVQLEADGRSPHTIAQYARHVRAFERWLVATKRSTDLAVITSTTVAQFFIDPAARCRSADPVTPKKPTSLNAMRSTLRCFFTYAHDAGLIALNPARLLRRARCAAPPPRSLSSDTEAALWTAIDRTPTLIARRDAALFRFLLRTGLRISSALAIQVEDLDHAAHEIAIQESKGSCRDRIPVSPSTLQLLRSWLGNRRHGALFPGRDGRPLGRRHVARRLAYWSAKAEILPPIHPHAFRHTFATRLLGLGHDLRLVQQAMRHRSIASTVQYTRVDIGRIRHALHDLESSIK